MSKPRNLRSWLVLGAVVIAGVIGWQFWEWEVERVEVPEGKFLVRIHRWGKNLSKDQIVAPDESYKGVMLDTKQEGRYFLNPLFWGYEIDDRVNVPAGKCLILTRKFGREIPRDRIERGQIMAQKAEQEIDSERGIVEEPLGPGSYRLNRHAYEWQLTDAIEIQQDQVGVRTLKIGRDPRDLPVSPNRPRFVVPDGYRGVQQTPIPNGTHYINPFKETITPVEVRRHRAELTDIEFPSRDGFILRPHVFVEYQVLANKAPEVLVRLSDEGQLHQLDSTPAQQEQNEILQKVILPHMRGYARIEGSNFDARDFIGTSAAPGERVINPRERLQKTLLDEVKPRCLELGIDIRAVLLADMQPPPELAEQISQRDLARVEQEKNVTRQGQYKEMQKLKSIEALKEQNRKKVEVDTRLLVAKTDARRRKQVEELKLKQELETAEINLTATKARAEAILAKATAQAAVTMLQNEAEVAGLRKKVQGFASAAHFAQYQILSKVAPALREIFASDDSDFGKLFSGYMSPPPASAGKQAPATAQAPTGNGTAPNNGTAAVKK